ncbi:MAG: DUF4038 domain-containing protein, partial [Bacteroidetes bacterium]|nr:DUF4038 domain-containing protein [Bacteroidota bacterium]
MTKAVFFICITALSAIAFLPVPPYSCSNSLTRNQELRDTLSNKPASGAVNSVSQRLPRLKVSENGRFLSKEDGTPFFYLGDTAWELFHRLNREEATEYLRNRAEKGFTVIQAVVLAEIGGLYIPNPYGHLPLENLDPTRPIEAYFEHVDFIVDQAERLGLYIGMLPTWGDKVNKKWGAGPEIFNPEN